MKYKINELKIWQKVKDNKLKISLISGAFATVLGTSLCMGYALNLTAGNTIVGNKNPDNNGGLPDGYVPEINVIPGEIKFDQNGELLIPELVDEENPSGNYEYKIEDELIIDDSIKNEALQEPDFIDDVNLKYDDLVNKNINTFSQEELSTVIESPSEFESFVNYYLPDNSIDFTSEMKFEQLFENLKTDSLKHTMENSISKSEASDLLALNGINFDKEYNKLMEMTALEEDSENNTQISVRGGGGGLPGGGANLPTIPDLPSDDNKFTITVAEIEAIYDRDLLTRIQFEVIYGALLIAISVASLALAIITFGASIASAVVDIVFCSIAMITSILECVSTRDNLVLPMKSLGQTLQESIEGELTGHFWSNIFDNIDSFYTKFIGAPNEWTKFKDKIFQWGNRFKLNHVEVSQFLLKNAKLLKLSLSILSFALTLVKEELYAFVYLPIKYILQPN